MKDSLENCTNESAISLNYTDVEIKRYRQKDMIKTNWIYIAYLLRKNLNIMKDDIQKAVIIWN